MESKNGSILQDWLLWLIVNFLGNVIWFCSCATPLVIIGDRDNDTALLLFYVSQAILTGVAQWWVIRWHVHQAGWWILATAIGCPVGLLLGIALVSGVSIASLSASIVWVVLGTSLGFTQWLVLRKRVQHAAWWIFASAALWGVSGLIGVQITAIVNGASVIVTSAASGAGLLTTCVLAESTRGLVLSWLLHRPTHGKINLGDA